MAVIPKCYEALATDCDRISCTVKMDWRKGASGRIDGKVKSVREKIGRPLRT